MRPLYKWSQSQSFPLKFSGAESSSSWIQQGPICFSRDTDIFISFHIHTSNIWWFQGAKLIWSHPRHSRYVTKTIVQLRNLACGAIYIGITSVDFEASHSSLLSLNDIHDGPLLPDSLTTIIPRDLFLLQTTGNGMYVHSKLKLSCPSYPKVAMCLQAGLKCHITELWLW